jgi:hypothetical protein
MEPRVLPTDPPRNIHGTAEHSSWQPSYISHPLYVKLNYPKKSLKNQILDPPTSLSPKLSTHLDLPTQPTLT